MSLPTGRRKGSCSLWLKRNWVLMSLVGLAAASAALSVLLYLKPCDKKTEYTTHNTSSVINVTSYENRTATPSSRSMACGEAQRLIYALGRAARSGPRRPSRGPRGT